MFFGGCTLEAIEEVCSGAPVERDEVMDLVAGLVARSLVVAEDGDTGTRYRLLETIRQYSEERLADYGEAEALKVRHSAYYAAFFDDAAEKAFGPDQLVWTRRIKVERDNFLAALANAVDSGDASAAVALVASYPIQYRAEGTTGEIIVVDVTPVLGMPEASAQPAYPFALLVAAYRAQSTGDWKRVNDLCQQALQAEARLGGPHGSKIEMEVCSLQAQLHLGTGAYAAAVSTYTRAAELAQKGGAVGMAAIFQAYKVTCALLGGAAAETLRPIAEEAVALARRSGMPSALVISLNALAMALTENDPQRAKAVLSEIAELASAPGQEVATGILLASMVATRLGDWTTALALAGRNLLLWRGVQAIMSAAPSLAICARALAEDRPEAAGVLRGAAYEAYHRGSVGHAQAAKGPDGSSVNYLVEGLREAGDLVTVALGDERRQQLRGQGAAMTLDEAVSYALSNIDPKLLTGPIASIKP